MLPKTNCHNKVSGTLLCIVISLLFSISEKALADPVDAVPRDTALKALVMQIDPLMQEKRYSEAEVLLKKALSIAPEDPAIHASYGYAIQKQGRFEESVAHYEAALKGLPEAILVRMSFAHVLKNLARYQEALAQYKKVLEQEPSYPMALRMTAITLVDLKLPQDSVPYCKRLLDLEPTQANRMLLADVLEESRDYSAAFLKYKEVLTSDPKYMDAINGCAVCLWSMGRQSEAVAYYEQAAESNPTNQRAWLKLLHYYLRTGRLKDWVLCQEKVAMRFPDSPVVKRLTNYRKEVAVDAELNEQTQQPSDDYLNRVIRSGKRRWQQRVIPVYIEPSRTSISGWNPKFDDILHQAFADWSESSAGLLSFKFVETPAPSGITCRWISSPDELPLTGANACCKTKCDGDLIVKADLVLLTTNSTFPDTALTLDYIKAITRHEVGHALGLEGHSDVVGDVMFTYPGSSQLTQRDVNTITRLYRDQK